MATCVGLECVKMTFFKKMFSLPFKVGVLALSLNFVYALLTVYPFLSAMQCKAYKPEQGQ